MSNASNNAASFSFTFNENTRDQIKAIMAEIVKVGALRTFYPEGTREKDKVALPDTDLSKVGKDDLGKYVGRLFHAYNLTLSEERKAAAHTIGLKVADVIRDAMIRRTNTAKAAIKAYNDLPEEDRDENAPTFPKVLGVKLDKLIPCFPAEYHNRTEIMVQTLIQILNYKVVTGGTAEARTYTIEVPFTPTDKDSAPTSAAA